MMGQLQQYSPIFVLIAIFVIAAMFFLWSGSGLFVFTNDAAELVQKGNYYFNVGGTGKYNLEKAENYFEKELDFIDILI